MENNKLATLSWPRCLFLLFLYFVFYAFLLHPILIAITLKINPSAQYVSIPVSFAIDVLLLICIVLISKPVWSSGIKQFCKYKSRNIRFVLKSVGIILVINLGLSLVVSLFTSTDTSVNQQTIMDNIKIAPMYMTFSTLVFAPIVEETIFRGMIFTKCRSYMKPKLAMLISAFTFGLMHVLSSFLSGNYVDVSYIVIYVAIGFVIAYAYEKSESIVVSAFVHFGNNFIAMLPVLLLLS